MLKAKKGEFDEFWTIILGVAQQHILGFMTSFYDYVLAKKGICN
jgi:hypothetical protein